MTPATLERPTAICARPGCGAVLSRYNRDPDGLCGSCRHDVDSWPETAAGVDLERLVAGLLLTHDALRPGETVNLARELDVLGVEANCWQIGLAVRHLGRRHGLVARGERGRPGYFVEEWERRYVPVHLYGNGVMERDLGTGRYASNVVCDGQLTLVED